MFKITQAQSHVPGISRGPWPCHPLRVFCSNSKFWMKATFCHQKEAIRCKWCLQKEREDPRTGRLFVQGAHFPDSRELERLGGNLNLALAEVQIRADSAICPVALHRPQGGSSTPTPWLSAGPVLHCPLTQSVPSPSLPLHPESQGQGGQVTVRMEQEAHSGRVLHRVLNGTHGEWGEKGWGLEPETGWLGPHTPAVRPWWSRYFSAGKITPSCGITAEI